MSDGSMSPRMTSLMGASIIWSIGQWSSAGLPGNATNISVHDHAWEAASITVDASGNPWFVGAGRRYALRLVGTDCRQAAQLYSPSHTPGLFLNEGPGVCVGGPPSGCSVRSDHYAHESVHNNQLCVNFIPLAGTILSISFCLYTC